MPGGADANVQVFMNIFARNGLIVGDHHLVGILHSTYNQFSHDLKRGPQASERTQCLHATLHGGGLRPEQRSRSLYLGCCYGDGPITSPLSGPLKVLLRLPEGQNMLNRCPWMLPAPSHEVESFELLSTFLVDPWGAPSGF